VDPQVKKAARLDRPAQVPGDPSKPRRANQQRFPAVEDDTHFLQAVVPGMLRNALPRLSDRLRRNRRRTVTPALIGVLIDIAVIASQVTATVYLEYELPERQYVPGSGQDSLR
jgi:hypothetical protein